MQKYLTIKEVAEALEVSTDTVRRRIKRGEMEAEIFKGPYGDQYYIPKEELGASRIQEVIPVKRDIAPTELKEFMQQAVDEQYREIKQELQEVKQQNEKMLQIIEKRDKELMQAIRDKQESSRKGFFRKLADFFR